MAVLDINEDLKTCFIICPIGEEESKIRENSNQFFEFIVEPVVKAFNYSLKRSDLMNENGMIMFQIIDQLVESPLVIADLTGNNPNVFYELAVRHVTKKPCILMKTEGQKTPFDVEGMRIISYDLKNLYKVEDAKKRLREQIKSMDNAKFQNFNPITIAYTYKKLIRNLHDIQHAEDDILTQVVGSIIDFNSTVNDMRREVFNLNNKLSFLEELSIPPMFEEQGLDDNEFIDKSISVLNRQLKEKYELNKDNDDPLNREEIEEIKQNIVNLLKEKDHYKKTKKSCP